jgi:RNA polymerase sigma-70 factor (ECF subfamily)
MVDHRAPHEQEQLARMEAALLRLPRLTREVFLANRLDHLTYAEIASRTGLTVPQVRRHMTRALLALEQAIRRETRPWWKFW